MKFLSIALMLLLAFTFSCAPRVLEGRRIDAEKVRQMPLGKTPVAQVEQTFGKPSKIEKMSTGEEKYIYIYRTKDPFWFTSDKVQAQNLEVIIKDGMVETYKFAELGDEAVLKE